MLSFEDKIFIKKEKILTACPLENCGRPPGCRRRTLFIHKTICCLQRNWSFFVFCDFPR